MEYEIELRTTSDFDRWLENQTLRNELQIRKRLLAIQQHGHLGDHKSLGGGLFELRWKNGRRLYFAKTGKRTLLLLLGGLKNEQEKQIKKARRMVR